MNEPDDIVTRLRRDCMSLIADEAADTIERLRRNTGCARNQHTTQFCAEALDAHRGFETLQAQLGKNAIALAATFRELRKVEAERDEAIQQAAEARQTIYRLQHELAGCSRAPADGKHTPAGETFIPEAL